MHLAIALACLTAAVGSLVFVIASGRKTKRLYAEAEANWKKAEERWERAAASRKRIADLGARASSD